MRFEICYQDSYDDCDSISVEEDEVFSISAFDDVSRPCYGGEIIDNDGAVVEDRIQFDCRQSVERISEFSFLEEGCATISAFSREKRETDKTI